MRRLPAFVLTLSLGALALPSHAEEEKPAPLYDVRTVAFTTTAVNYMARSVPTKADLAATPIGRRSAGTVTVNPQKGVVEVTARVREMPAAASFGPEYLTYVLWAVTPEGRANNLGEIVLDSYGGGKLQASTRMQSFALIVTAEPHFAVTLPSDIVVLENAVRPTTTGEVEAVQVRTELLPRDLYAVDAGGAIENVTGMDEDPLDILEARNAIRLARWAGAETHAADVLAKAEGLLRDAEAAKGKAAMTPARASVQAAEDARVLTLRRKREARIAAEKADSAAREEAARKQAADEAHRREQAEAEERKASLAREQAEIERMRAEAEAQRAHAARLAAERQQADLRASLLAQFSKVLDTRESDRGLVVNMSDVLFDTSRAELKPVAREHLARISGIVVAHPGLALRVEGHADSTGTADFNQKLSEARAGSVRDYLVAQGIPGETITSAGLGSSVPVAPNDTADGRAKNRRVELIVSGEVIGTKIGPQ